MVAELAQMNTRSKIELSVVLTVTMVLVSSILFLHIFDLLHGYFAAAHMINAQDMIVQSIFLGLCGLLWITYRRWKTAEDRQKELENIFDGISPDVLMVVDPDGIISMCNPSVKRLFGYEISEVLNRRTDYLFKDEESNRGRRNEIIEQLQREGFHVGSATGRRKDGDVIPLETITGSLTGQEGVVMLLRDISDRNQLQEQLIHSEKLSSLGQLIAGVAHELNNPLTSVIGYSQLLQGVSDLPPTTDNMLEQIYSEAERARKIVQNLLVFARQAKPTQSMVHVNTLLKQVLDFRGYELRISNVEVITAFDDDIPYMYADEHQLQQVFMNIILNAEQALGGTGTRGCLTVSTSLDRNENTVRIDVADSGPGIDPEHLVKVFDPFFTTKPPGLGTGLGLSLSHGIVREHGGEIRAANAPQGGAVFTVVLPVAESGIMNETAGRPPRDERVPAADRTVLVVDGERRVRTLVRDVLREEGYSVETVPDAGSALRIIDENHIDAVITEVRMPGQSGIDLYASCLDGKPDLAGRFLFMTGDTIAPDALRFLEDHGLPLVVKPFNLDDLVESFNRLFEDETVPV